MSVKDSTEKKRKIKTDASLSNSVGGEKKKSRLSDLKDSNKSLFYYEEDHIDERDANKDLDQFRNACKVIKKSIFDIQKLKDEKKSLTETAVNENRTDAVLQFANLKKLNRLAHIRCKKVRDGTNDAKQRIDQYHLQLQNLLYEAYHLQKEVTKCFEFKSKDEEIELISKEEFFAQAPPEVTKPDITKKDVHQLMLARLDWELEQRKLLAIQLRDSQTQKDKLLQEIKTKQEYLDSLQPKLTTILQSTKPVQEYLQMPFDKNREQRLTACHLPHPLYALYMQTSAYKDACDKNLVVDIEGDLDAAKSLDTSEVELDEESDSDQEEQEKQTSSRRRKTTEDRTSAKKNRALKKHPLSVTLDVICKDVVLHLNFFYLLALHIVTVNVEVKMKKELGNCVSGGDLLQPDTLLNELYPGDNGETTPNPANKYFLSSLGMDDFSSFIPAIGLPYVWVQWLGGLQFTGDSAPEKAKSAISSNHMRDTIKLLRQRINARLSLLQQLSSLERNILPVVSKFQNMYPSKIASRLVSWKRSTYDNFILKPHTSVLQNMFEFEETDYYFLAIVERGSAKLLANIVITPDYPQVVPVFSISIRWQTDETSQRNAAIKDMEEEINVHYTDFIKGDIDNNILSNQLQRLLVCFDVYLESKTQNSTVEGPVEISKEKVFTRSSKGPSRRRPYKFLPQMGIFTQR